ncbi:ribosomal protein S2 [Teratosphaeria nubilosa]|uniref:Ribosomal protein S2 n=1 Tax=Teratosphaeria nubilosa TaxID=161662 RepID=A0A6G1L227_9PEZI|nr:ribosomal protein S2 [Teratosphaeria nubilosa]
MIIRSLLLRHGKLALPRSSPSPARRRLQTTAHPVEAYHPPYQDQQHVEGGIGGSKSEATNALAARNDPTSPLESARVKADWDFYQHQKRVTAHVGAVQAPHYRPRDLLLNPPKPQDITLELLMASQTHLGHATSLWHPANAKYIFGVRGTQDPIHIISLDVTAAHLRRACRMVQGVAERGGLVLFVGSRSGQARTVVKAAQMAGACHLFDKWIPGSITNGQQILGKCEKKVVNEFDEAVEGFEEQLYDKPALKPDLVVCLNPLENYVLLHECGLNHIPTIGVVDTDVNPTWVTYPIPANDDSLRSIQVIAGALGRAGEEGQAIRKLKAESGRVDYRQDHGLRPPSEEDEQKKLQREKEQSLLSAVDSFNVEELYADDMEEEISTPPPSAVTSASPTQPLQTLAANQTGEGDVDPSLMTEQQAQAFDEVFQPYEVDQRLEGAETAGLEESMGRIEYQPTTSGERDAGSTPQPWGHRVEQGEEK